MNTSTHPRIISQDAYQSIMSYDPFYAAAATVAVDMGFWKIEKNAIPEGKGVGR